MKSILGLVATLMTGAMVARADAAAIYSLTGTVGDSNWSSSGLPVGEYGLIGGTDLPTSPPPPAFTGKYGTFSGKTEQYDFKFTTSANIEASSGADEFYTDAGEIIYDKMTGTYDKFSSFGGGGIDNIDGISTTGGNHSVSFQVASSVSSTYVDEGYVTDYLVPDQDSLQTYSGELVFWQTTAPIIDLGWGIVAQGNTGEPFSLLVTSGVPEVRAWVLMLLGFACVGSIIRLNRHRYVI
jgi:hypothetical protein